MIKRVNSTGRRRIARDRVKVEVLPGTPRTFDAAIDLSGFDALPDAEVVIEATCAGSNVIPRFRWGTVCRLEPPDDRSLADLHGEHVFFSLKVIDRSERFGRILGVAQNIRSANGGPKAEAGRQGILPVNVADLGDELWRLDFKTENVVLLVNSRTPDLIDKVRYDPAVFALIYPSVVREVLGRAFQEDDSDDDEEDERWPALWLRFARGLHPERAAPPPADDEEGRREWTDEAVAAFCKQHKLRTKFGGGAGVPASGETD